MIWNQSCFIVPQREKVMCLHVRSCHINIFKHRMLAKRSHNVLKVINDIFFNLLLLIPDSARIYIHIIYTCQAKHFRYLNDLKIVLFSLHCQVLKEASSDLSTDEYC